MALWALIIVGLASGAVLGWVALFRSLAALREVAALRSDLAALRRRIDDLARLAPRAPGFAPAGPAPPAAEPGPAVGPAPAAARAPAHPATEGLEAEAAAEPIRQTTEGEPRSAATEATPPPPLARFWAPLEAAAGPGGLEKRLAGAWLIWLGGAALLMGGAFLVKSAIDAGFFGPIMRVAAGVLAGGVMIYFGDRLRRAVVSGKIPSRLAAAVLAGAGGSAIYGAIYAAHGLYGLIPPIVALLLLAGACAGLVVLAVIHRASPVAGLGLVGAYLSPILAASGEPAPAPLFLYVFGVAFGGLAVARIMNWRAISYAALAGGVLWPLLWIAAGDSVQGAAALAAYLPAFFVMNVFIAAGEAKAPLDPGAILRNGLRAVPVSLAAAHIAAAAIYATGYLYTEKEGLAGWTIALWTALIFTAIAAAARREGFSIIPLLATGALAATLALVGDGRDGFIEIGAAFAAALAGGGLILARIHREKTAAAALIAFGPLAILAAMFLSVAALEQAPAWGAAALALAFFNAGLVANLVRREGGVDAAPGAASAYALGASLGAALAVAMSADGFWMSAGFACQAPVLAWLWRRFDLPALKLAAMALATLASVRLLFFLETLHYDVGELPIVNALIPGYLAPALGFWLAARWFEGGGLERNSVVVQSLEAGAIALFAAFASLEIRHLMNAGALDAPLRGLIEISLQTVSWILLAAFLRLRFGAELTAARLFAERILLSLGALAAFFANLTTRNPWWGEGPAIAGPPVFNILLIAYLTPAAAFAAAALAARRSGATFQARAAALLAALLAYAWLVLTIRHAFHGPTLDGPIGESESWAYSIATTGYAAFLLVIGALRRSAVLRLGGLVALLLAVVKVFLVDLADLDGLLRATSFLGLGAALVGIAVLYQRVLAPFIENDAR